MDEDIYEDLAPAANQPTVGTTLLKVKNDELVAQVQSLQRNLEASKTALFSRIETP